jgi:hypothetical protein
MESGKRVWDKRKTFSKGWIMGPWLLLTVAVMTVAWIIAPAAWADGRFDGAWKVIASTTEGRCPKFYVFPVTIRNGAISGFVSGVKGRYEIKGRVLKDGSFSWGWGHSTGKLSDNEGTGRWVNTAGVRGENCAGDLSLQRER